MDLFTALADQTRRQILEMLAQNKELSASEIYAHFTISPQAISQHLKVLREVKLVYVERRAQLRIYRINTEAMIELESWFQKMRHYWIHRLDALDEVLAAEWKEIQKNKTSEDDVP
ncbi:transcriptional regulator, ArsR family [Seinonella peptonophila]|uniref:Transcriptional regulator, ArsR family n=1 Tax=Seinonella peptonophila TaxID=112248 RepID=A0A1M4YRA0_9BACL|nr:metalloregulator ArsR/SmtB family transcription factor [Seinonella peptonophila]SHF07866.1 transcriptional regulator, ArsR family [Seinonella peptonophila]